MTPSRPEDVSGHLNLHVFLSGIENETRLFKEARYTLEQGIFGRVVVLGLWAKGLRPHEVTSYGLEIRRLTVWIRRHGDSGLLHRLPLLRKLVAALSMVQYSVLAINVARQLRPSHVSCHNVMLLPTAWAAARLGGSRLVYVPHELESRRSGLGAFMQKLQGAVERAFIPAASQIVVVSDPIAAWYRRHYRLDNVNVVRNVPERSAVDVRPLPSGDFRSRFGIPPNAKVFIYQGIFGKARGTNRLLEIFARMDPEAAHLVLMGYGERDDQTTIDAFVANHPNIHYQPAVPREWIVSYTSGADIGLLIVEDAPLSYRYALPNKFFEYAHAGLPVLVSDNFELQAEIIAEHGLGWSAPYAEIEETIVALTMADLAPWRKRAREFARSAIWEADAQAYSSVYHS